MFLPSPLPFPFPTQTQKTIRRTRLHPLWGRAAFDEGMEALRSHTHTEVVLVSKSLTLLTW